MYLSFPRYILVRHNFSHQTERQIKRGGSTAQLICSRRDIVSTHFEASLVFSTRCIVTDLTNLLSSARDWRTQELPTPGFKMGQTNWCWDMTSWRRCMASWQRSWSGQEHRDCSSSSLLHILFFTHETTHWGVLRPGSCLFIKNWPSYGS